jgi:hypothetical protein
MLWECIVMIEVPRYARDFRKAHVDWCIQQAKKRATSDH